MKAWLERRWYSESPPPLPLRPLSALYGAVAGARRRRLSAAAPALPLPVIVVGNISLGGTGKTPFTIWLIERLREWGWKPGIVSRGYGGRAPRYPLAVTPDSDPALAGDEPVMMAQRLGCPLVVDPDRVAAARALIERGGVDIIVADDGLQHYRLARQREFCVVDGARGLGNGALLPAGPLREPPARLREVDFVVVNGEGWQSAGQPCLRMELAMGEARALRGGERRPLAALTGQRVHAVAGIGHPARFFAALERLGIEAVPHAFADHHAYVAADLQFGDPLPILMTEKDAVKCRALGVEGWFVPVEAVLGADAAALVRQSIDALRTPA